MCGRWTYHPTASPLLRGVSCLPLPSPLRPPHLSGKPPRLEQGFSGMISPYRPGPAASCPCPTPLLSLGVKSHELQLLQIPLDDDVVEAFSVPCGPGRRAVST